MSAHDAQKENLTRMNHVQTSITYESMHNEQTYTFAFSSALLIPSSLVSTHRTDHRKYKSQLPWFRRRDSDG